MSEHVYIYTHRVSGWYIYIYVSLPAVERLLENANNI